MPMVRNVSLLIRQLKDGHEKENCAHVNFDQRFEYADRAIVYLHFFAASFCRSDTILSRDRTLCPLRDDPLELDSDDEPLSEALESDEPARER